MTNSPGTLYIFYVITMYVGTTYFGREGDVGPCYRERESVHSPPSYPSSSGSRPLRQEGLPVTTAHTRRTMSHISPRRRYNETHSSSRLGPRTCFPFLPTPRPGGPEVTQDHRQQHCGPRTQPTERLTHTQPTARLHYERKYLSSVLAVPHFPYVFIKCP